MQNLFDINGKYILVTGASSGLGKYLAMMLAAHGANLIICARRLERLEELQKKIEEQHSVEVLIYSVDVTNRNAIKDMISDLDNRGVAIDCLINNAGIADTNRFLDYTDSDWESIVGTNLKAPWQCAQEVVRHMVKHQRGGSIINVTSILSQSVNAGVGPYCAAKAGLRHLTQTMAVELARYHIRVNALAPGYVMTELNTDYLSSESGQKLMKRIPMRRFNEYADLDGVVLLLASDASRGMTGVEIKVDNGHSCTPI